MACSLVGAGENAPCPSGSEVMPFDIRKYDTLRLAIRLNINFDFDIDSCFHHQAALSATIAHT